MKHLWHLASDDLLIWLSKSQQAFLAPLPGKAYDLRKITNVYSSVAIIKAIS